MKKFIFLLVAVTVLSYNVDAQSKKELKKKTLIANELLANNRYESADKLFSELLNSDKNNLDFIFSSGLCKLNLGNEDEAINLFSTIIDHYKKEKKESTFTREAFFQKAKAFHNIYQFDEEISILKDLLSFELNDKEKEQVATTIKSAENAKKIFFNFKPIIVTRLDILNSGYDDHTPIPTANGTKLYFTSKRLGGISGKTISEEGKYFEDIWSWEEGSKPINIGGPVNTLEHDATGGLSLDGKKIIIYRASKKKRGDLYSSILSEDGKWSDPISLGKNINKRKSVERHAAISPDGKKIYFSSDRKGGKGGRDIWMSELQENNKWGKPTNLNINTDLNEESPYMLSDGITFYFSSTGYNGMGGYDIFKCMLQDDGTFTTPENIGFPINTVEDDVFFFPLSNEKTAYFTRRKSDNAEIYKTIFPDNTIIVNSNILGKEVDKDSYKMNSEISVIDVNSEDVPNFYSLNLEKGVYNTVVTSDKSYKFYYEATDYVFDTENIKQEDMIGLEKIKKDPILVKIEEGKTEKFKNLNFENNSSDFNPFSSTELDLIAANLNKYDNLVVNFSAQDNNISKERKDKAIDYLKNKGIGADKIFVDLSTRTIPENNLEYTIYDITSANKIIADNKEDVIVTEKDYTIEIENVFFNFDKFKMQITANDKLDLLAKYLSENSSAKISVTGYTDAVGSKSYNNRLSLKRANTVQKYLVGKGANKNQIETFAYGEDNPITLNKKNNKYFEPSKKFNRRVEFYVLSQGTPKLKIVQFKNVPSEYKDATYRENYKKFCTHKMRMW